MQPVQKRAIITLYAVEIRLRHKDESYCWFLIQGEAHRDTAGQPVRMVARSRILAMKRVTVS